jgi:hypothetical protein
MMCCSREVQGGHEVILRAGEPIVEDWDEKTDFSSSAIVIAGYCAGRLGKRVIKVSMFATIAPDFVRGSYDQP